MERTVLAMASGLYTVLQVLIEHRPLALPCSDKPPLTIKRREAGPVVSSMAQRRAPAALARFDESCPLCRHRYRRATEIALGKTAKAVLFVGDAPPLPPPPTLPT